MKKAMDFPLTEQGKMRLRNDFREKPNAEDTKGFRSCN
jgi:hypothetical protein